MIRVGTGSFVVFVPGIYIGKQIRKTDLLEMYDDHEGTIDPDNQCGFFLFEKEETFLCLSMVRIHLQ